MLYRIIWNISIRDIYICMVWYFPIFVCNIKRNKVGSYSCIYFVKQLVDRNSYVKFVCLKRNT